MFDPRDQAYVETISDPELREVVTCALTTYRVPDVIRVGDALPRVALHPLGQTEPDPVVLRTAGRPLVLVFGSYT